ncbi:hypothetical protein CEXT_711191 [Caerostris extrusa]|uniref:Uncharacterized protein n=1 Tax=Caerostris extrusa TaxID=172846 RepID=A0AAV4PRE1_CAEEX|nr:hypothetical protein CEXT_711191 [Caerostris extrusa]
MFIDFAVYLISLKDGDKSQGMGKWQSMGEGGGKAKEINKSKIYRSFFAPLTKHIYSTLLLYVVSKDIGNLAQISKSQNKCAEEEIGSGRRRTTQFGAPYHPMTSEMSISLNHLAVM